MTSEDRPNIPIWKSHVFHKDKCFFVSTIERTYDVYEGSVRGFETLVWEYDWGKGERGKLIYQAEGIDDHQKICRSIIASGETPDGGDEDVHNATRERSARSDDTLGGIVGSFPDLPDCTDPFTAQARRDRERIETSDMLAREDDMDSAHANIALTNSPQESGHAC